MTWCTYVCIRLLLSDAMRCQVRLATDTSNGKLVALKIIQKEWIYENDVGALVQREIDIVRGKSINTGGNRVLLYICVRKLSLIP